MDYQRHPHGFRLLTYSAPTSRAGEQVPNSNRVPLAISVKPDPISPNPTHINPQLHIKI